MSVDRASAEMWASWFRALGDGSRVLILHHLATAGRPLTVGEIVDAVDVGQSTVSHHLKLLAEVGFLHVEHRGNTSLYRVDERCLEVFPSAAEVVMGQLPRYDPNLAACAAPWATDRAGSTTASATADPTPPRESNPMSTRDARTESLRAHDGAAARKAATGAAVIDGCGGTSADACCAPAVDAGCGPVLKDSTETIGAGLYDRAEVADLPSEAVAGSIGGANPVAPASRRA